VRAFSSFGQKTGCHQYDEAEKTKAYLALVSFKMASTADPMADVAPMSTSSAASWAWGARPIELWIEFNALHVSFFLTVKKLSILSSLIPLLHQPGNDPSSGVLPVKSIGQFLSVQVSYYISIPCMLTYLELWKAFLISKDSSMIASYSD